MEKKELNIPQVSLSNQYAFPVDGQFAADAMKHRTAGLTKREYFAGLAMQANADNDEMSPYDIAIHAVNLADELIKILNQGGEI